MTDDQLPFFNLENPAMQDFLKYLSTAPVVATIWMVITAGILIEFNRFIPDMLVFRFGG
jgi:photosystem I subunit 9